MKYHKAFVACSIIEPKVADYYIEKIIENNRKLVKFLKWKAKFSLDNGDEFEAIFIFDNNVNI